MVLDAAHDAALVEDLESSNGERQRRWEWARWQTIASAAMLGTDATGGDSSKTALRFWFSCWRARTGSVRARWA